MADLTEITFDYIVVGSGPSGAMCAQTLVEAGRKVLMLDAGLQANNLDDTITDTFEEIRKTRRDQHKTFLGERFESISQNTLQKVAQLTPQRLHVTDTKHFLPFNSNSFFPVESLAYGGLGEAWGLGCNTFSENELRQVGLNVSEMKAAYQCVADRIGISYTKNDVELFTMPGIKNLQPGIIVDDNAFTLLNTYNSRKRRIQKEHFFMGTPSLALLTRDKNERLATQYTDMDFYGNPGNSAYRPSITIRELEKSPNFVYKPDVLVTSFSEAIHDVTVMGTAIDTNVPVSYSGKKLMLASNVLSTARIVLRSFDAYDTRIPILCNPYSYLSCLALNRLGKLNGARRTSTVQLSLFHDADLQNADVAMASIYSYGSLMMFRVLNETFVNVKDALAILRFLMPSIIIGGIHHPDKPGVTKYVRLLKSQDSWAGDILDARYKLSEEEEIKIERRNKKFASIFRQLRCLPLKKVTPPVGASVHYAGTLPFHNTEERLTTQFSGRLSATKNVFVADGSGFKFLPAKGITFSLMANAHRTALNALQDE